MGNHYLTYPISPWIEQKLLFLSGNTILCAMKYNTWTWHNSYQTILGLRIQRPSISELLTRQKKKMRLTNNYEIMQIVHLGRHFYHLYVNEHLPSELYFKWTFAAT